MGLYNGYNTVDNKDPRTRLEDVPLIRRDLINHFHIRKGEKLMRPRFGTIIWDVLFEPMTDNLRSAIIDDVNEIINYDPRIEPVNVLVDNFEHGILIEATVRYRNTNQTENLRLLFDRESNSLGIQ